MRANHDSLATLFENFQLFVEHKLLERCGTCSNTVLTQAIYESLQTTYFIQRSIVIHTKKSKQLESF